MAHHGLLGFEFGAAHVCSFFDTGTSRFRRIIEPIRSTSCCKTVEVSIGPERDLQILRPAWFSNLTPTDMTKVD